MKQYLSTVLALICLVLVAIFIAVKHGDNTQHETDSHIITDFSNRLDSAQTQIAFYNGSMLTLSNSLDESRSATLAFSNRLMEAISIVALEAGQITNLNQQVVRLETENQTSAQRVMDLTNQVTGLTSELTLTKANLSKTNQDLVQAYKDYALLENRFRIDVAERVVIERKFNNPLELQAQMQKLKENPFNIISSESIYAGLDVEVKSNSVHVISPN